MDVQRTSIRILAGTFVVYALLVATHLGEFWPFSIYPMFSQAGQPWSRALVRTVPRNTDRIPEDTVALADLPGDPFPVVPEGLSQNDVANYVSKTETWTPERRSGLRSLFTEDGSLERPLLIYRVWGKLVADSVRVRAAPVLLLTPDSSRLHPSLIPD